MKRIVGIMISACVAGAGVAEANGFAVPSHSAAGAGLANAFVATANDASAIAYNPAGIAWQNSVAVTIGARIDYRDSSVKLAGGNIAPNNGADPNTPYIYALWAPLDKKWAIGGGYAPLYYLNNDWTTAYPGSSGISQLIVEHASADFVYAVSSSLAVGVGGDWYVSRASFRQGTATTQATDLGGFGGHVSTMWKPAYGWSVGAMYRSGSSVNIDGGAGDKMKFKLPDEVTLGVAHDFTDAWRFEVDGKWTRWSALKDFNVVTAGAITQANPLNLRDTFAVMAGVTWTWRPNTTFRIGYGYEQGANKSNGFNPIMADQDGHNISMGASGNVFGFHVDLAYNYTFYPKKTATGTYAGTYRDRRQALQISTTWRFD